MPRRRPRDTEGAYVRRSLQPTSRWRIPGEGESTAAPRREGAPVDAPLREAQKTGCGTRSPYSRLHDTASNHSRLCASPGRAIGLLSRPPPRAWPLRPGERPHARSVGSPLPPPITECLSAPRRAEGKDSDPLRGAQLPDLWRRDVVSPG
jgi:hypothetical protein